MENAKPNYYSILTADVRYDDRLSSTEKLLYSEITALSSKDGICWASNKYFADLYKLTPEWVSMTIKKLKEYGYIETEIIYKDKQIVRRNIYLLNKSLRGIKENLNRGIKENLKDNNININNTRRIIPQNNFTQDDLDGLYDN